MGASSKREGGWRALRLPRRPAWAFATAFVSLLLAVVLTFTSSAREDAAARTVARTLELQRRLFTALGTMDALFLAQLEQHATGIAEPRAGPELALALDALDAIESMLEAPEDLARIARVRPLVQQAIARLTHDGGLGSKDVVHADIRRLSVIRGELRLLLADQNARLLGHQARAERAGSVADAVLLFAAIDLAAVLLFAAKISSDEFRRREDFATFQERMVGIVTHDLRSPLAAILAQARYLQRQPAPVGTFAGHIGNCAVRIDRLTRVIAAFAGSQIPGGLLLDCTPCDLNELSRTAIQDVRDGRESTIETQAVGELTGCWDRALLIQLVTTLLDNALRHGTPGGRVLVTASGAASSVQLSVHNDGQIAQERRAHLFEAASQHAADQTVRFSGGLGLFVVRKIVQAHGGNVWVQSSPQTGTTFVVTLPRDARTLRSLRSGGSRWRQLLSGRSRRLASDPAATR